MIYAHKQSYREAIVIAVCLVLGAVIGGVYFYRELPAGAVIGAFSGLFIGLCLYRRLMTLIALGLYLLILNALAFFTAVF